VQRLKKNTTYHYRLVALNSAGRTFGKDRTFKTAAPGKNPYRLPKSSKCIPDAKLVFRPRRPGGTHLKHVRLYVNGNKVLDGKKSNIVKVTLKNVPVEPFKLKVVGNWGDGPQVTQKRKLHACG
jgi:hypothetical protein